MCSLFFCGIIFINTYHTSEQNIQILGYLGLKNFSELCYNKIMTEELDDYGYEGDKCCAGCTCTMAHSSVPPVE